MIAILALFLPLETSLFYFAISLTIFIQISQFLKNNSRQLLLTSFVLAHAGNQLKDGPNATEADDTSMQQCAVVHYACKMVTMLTCDTSELSGTDL